MARGLREALEGWAGLGGLTRSCGGDEGQAVPGIEARGNGNQRSLETGGQRMESTSAGHP